MARIYEFVMGSDGDPSVGIFGFREKVTIIFHSDGSVPTEDEEDYLLGCLRELADGYCVPLREWEEAQTRDAINDALLQAEQEGHPLEKPIERVTRDMAIDAGDPKLEGQKL